MDPLSRVSLACKHSATVMPDPSLKQRASGKPASPCRRYAVPFRQPRRGVLPSLLASLSADQGIATRNPKLSALESTDSISRRGPPVFTTPSA